MYHYEKTSQKDWKTYIFLGRVHFFLLFWNLKTSKKSVPLREKQSKGVKSIHFPRKGTLFLLFWNLKNSKKKCTFTRKTVKRTEKHTFPRKGTFLLLFSSRYNSGHYFSFFSTFFFPGTVQGNLALGPEEPGWIVKISFKVRPSCRGHFRADVPETIRLGETSITIL